MKKLAIAILSVVVCFDVGGAVSEYHTSAHTPDYSANINCIVNPTSVPSVATKYWKRSGSDVLEMTAGEKATVDTTEAAPRTARTAAISSVRTKLTALGLTTDETNVLLGGNV